MTPESPPSSPLDGITSPQAEPERLLVPTLDPVTAPPMIKKAGPLNMTLVSFLVIALVYALPGFLLMAIFPRTDGSLSQLKLGANAVYALGALVWLLMFLLGLSRIAAIKDHPRLKLPALVRLLAGCIPMLMVSGLVLFLINTAPRLYLQVVSPSSSADLIAPLSVTFGMETALKVLTQQGLKPLKYEWDFNGDGIVDQETFDPLATFFVAKSGIYNVTSRVTMTTGEVKNVVLRFVVPRGSFGVDPPSPIIDEPVTFTIEHLFQKGDSKGPVLQKAKWDFDGDGVIDLETEKMIATTTYRKLGPVNVSVAMTLMNQTQSTLQRRVEVVKPMEQPFPITLETEPATLLGPPPFGVVFTLKTQEPIANVTWDFGDHKSGEGLRIAHVYSSVGSFTVNAAARSQSGAIAKLTKLVRVTNPLNIPDLFFEGKPPVKSFQIEGKVPLFVDITPITSQPLISFSWDAENASDVIATQKNFHAVYRDEGRYFVDLIGTDPDQNVFRKRITINALPAESIVSFTMNPATPTAPAEVTFDASDTFVPSGEEITGFEWNFGDGNGDSTKFSGSRITHVFDSPGTFSITLNVRTTSNKVYTGKQTLLVKAPLVDACFLPSRRTGTAPLGVRFDSSCSTGAFTAWLWDFGDNAESDLENPTHVFLEPGEYRVVLKATTNDGKKLTKNTIISVSAPTQ